MTNSPTEELEASQAKAQPAPTADAEPIPFDPTLLMVFVAVLLAICWQNWVLARRAEGKSLLPDWLASSGERE